MKKRKIALSVLLFIEVFSGCNLKSHPEQEYMYIPLEEYKYNAASIQPGTEVELLAFSGGKENDKENIYYYQFIVLNKTNMDTLRILTPLISIDESAGVENKTYTTPLQYDPEKGITNAFFEPKDSSQNLLLQIESLVKDDKKGNSVDVESLMKKVDKKQFVVVNKSMSEFENPHYHTVIGILNFKKMPW
jgi:hypothetical protein